MCVCVCVCICVCVMTQQHGVVKDYVTIFMCDTYHGVPHRVYLTVYRVYPPGCRTYDSTGIVPSCDTRNLVCLLARAPCMSALHAA